MSKILVTGGMGFIGSHTVQRLLADEHEVMVLDRQRRADPWHGAVSIMLGDVNDAPLVYDAVQACDAVINLAGILGTAETIDEPSPSVTTNIMGALNVFKACRPTRARPHGVRGVQISVGNWFMHNSYAITKHAAERLALMFNAEHGTKIAIVRALNAYGPWQKHQPIRKIMPNLILRALTGQPIEVYGDGTQIMDMIAVEDVAQILVAAVTTEHGCYDRVMEAGTGRALTVNDIAEQVIQVSQSTSELVHLPMRAGEPPQSVVLGDPATLEPLGIKSIDLIHLERGLPPTVAWYRDALETKRLVF
jgi:UDP-glucose 4-epimerase